MSPPCGRKWTDFTEESKIIESNTYVESVIWGIYNTYMHTQMKTGDSTSYYSCFVRSHFKGTEMAVSLLNTTGTKVPQAYSRGISKIHGERTQHNCYQYTAYTASTAVSSICTDTLRGSNMAQMVFHSHSLLLSWEFLVMNAHIFLYKFLKKWSLTYLLNLCCFGKNRVR